MAPRIRGGGDAKRRRTPFLYFLGVEEKGKSTMKGKSSPFFNPEGEGGRGGNGRGPFS